MSPSREATVVCSGRRWSRPSSATSWARTSDCRLRRLLREAMTDSIEQLCLNPFLVSRRRPAQDGFTCENPFLNTDFVLEGGSFAQLVAALRGAVGRAEIQAILCERFE